jgi:translation initiation factor 2 alpha subunit (eIF-2alpha)
VQVERKRRHVDLSLRDVAAGRRGRQQQQPKAGDMVTGRVAAIAGGRLRVQLTPRVYGHLALTDLHDSWVPNALEGGWLAGWLAGWGPQAAPALRCARHWGVME